MKLTSTLSEIKSIKQKTTVISNDCTMGQALIMIESWCYDNNADYPSLDSLHLYTDTFAITIYTKDNKYVNFFEITKD